jgi:hypothetical protein
MADGTYSRSPRAFVSRTGDAHAPDSRDFDGQASDPRGFSADRRPTSDPLQELARLIGQRDRGRDDTERGLGSPLGVPANRDQREYQESGPAAGFVRQDSYQDPETSSARSGLALSEQLLEQMREQVRQERERQTRSRYDHAAEAPPAATAPAHGDPTFAEATYQAHPGYATDHNTQAHDQVQAPDQAYAAGEDYTQDAQHEGYEKGEYLEDDAEDCAPEEYETEGETGDVERTSSFRRRHATTLAVAVLGLAVVGTAAAFGYYTVFKGGVQGAPPVIKADSTPTKMVPAGTSGEVSSKPINERLGDRSQERMVRREEAPVMVRDPSRPANGIPVMAAPSAIGAPDIAVPVAPGSSAEPKKVRTVTIRADQPMTAPERATPPTRIASTTRSAAQQVASAQPAMPAPVTGAPLALTPQAVGSAQALAEPGAQSPPARARPPRSDGGSFVVQLSAQKTEVEAQASFSAMQQRYSALSGRQPLIRRKDQGDRGVFYAAQVGPFGSREEAVQLCDSLKSVGGSCFVQRN